MLPETERLLRDPGTELVFGLVAPVGADLTWIEERLATLLRLYGYTPKHIRLSKLLEKIPDIAEDLKDTPEVDRINTYMDGGNELRDRAGAGEVLALWALSEIYQKRTEADSASPDRSFRTAYILRSSTPTKLARFVRFTVPASFDQHIGFSPRADFLSNTERYVRR